MAKGERWGEWGTRGEVGELRWAEPTPALRTISRREGICGSWLFLVNRNQVESARARMKQNRQVKGKITG